MADALWHSASMRALRPQLPADDDGDTAGRGDVGCTLWRLPNWDEYSESDTSVSARRLDLSICSSDAEHGGDSSSSDASGSDEFKRGARVRRSPVSIQTEESLPKRRSALQELHLRYAKQRQLDELSASSRGAVESRAGPSGHGRELVPAVRGGRAAAVGDTKPDDDAKAIAAQQRLLDSQLQAFRSQLSEMKQRMTVDIAAVNAPDSLPPDAAASVEPTQQNQNQAASSSAEPKARYDTSMQTDSPDLRDGSVVQWLSLLTQKIELLASEYGHDATQSYRATIEHLESIQGSAAAPVLKASDCDEPQHGTSGSTLGASTSQRSSWRVGGALHVQLSPSTVARFQDLEASLARLSSAFERSSQRQLELFEKSIHQIESFHHEKLQKVVNESIDELKQVRGKYKSKQEQLEEEVRAMTRAADEWKQTAVEVEHKSALEREKVELQAATFREKFERLSVRFDEDIARITHQLDAARREKADAQRNQATSSEAIAQLERELASLQQQYEVVASKRELESKLAEQEQQHWQASLDQLRRENDAAVHEISKEKQSLANALENAKQKHASEIATLENRFQMEVEDTYRATVVSETVVELQRRHEKQLEALRTSYEQQVEEQGRAVERALEELRESRRAQPVTTSSETQTEFITLAPLQSTPAAAGDDQHQQREAEVRIRELSRKCKALENLLDKKFEQQSAASSQYGGSASPFCMSCSSNSNSSMRVDSSTVPMSPQPRRSPSNFLSPNYEPASSKPLLQAANISTATRRLAQKKGYAASPSPLATSLDDALFTDVDTTMRNETTWDSVSMTSIDTFDPSTPSSHRALSRPQSATRAHSARGASPSSNSSVGNGRVPSNADILALVRKLENYAASSTSSIFVAEPEPEQSVVGYRTPESRVNSSRKTKPPPIQRSTQQHLRNDASGVAAARKAHKPSTTMTRQPLRGSLLSDSSPSSETQRHRSALAAPRSRFI